MSCKKKEEPRRIHKLLFHRAMFFLSQHSLDVRITRLALEPKLRNGDTRCCVWTPCVNHLPLVAFITIPELAWYELPEIDGATCWCTPRRRDAIAAAGLVLPMWNGVCAPGRELWHAASCEVLLAWLHVGRVVIIPMPCGGHGFTQLAEGVLPPSRTISQRQSRMPLMRSVTSFGNPKTYAML